MAKAYRKKDFDKLMTKVDRIDHRVRNTLKMQVMKNDQEFMQ